jgi:hypothetical protein
MTLRLALFGATLALVAAACGGEDKEKEQASAACGPAPATLAKPPRLPSGFPSPGDVTYTGSHKAGPSTIVDGYWDGDVDAAFDGYKDAFDNASGYDVTKDEHEEDDAEVNFSGGGTTGQVKLLQTCADRTTVTITIRPA